MKFSNMAAILSLSAGFVVCVVTFLSGMELLNSLIWVLVALTVFYILGLALKALFNVILKEDTDETAVTEEQENSEEIQETTENK